MLEYEQSEVVVSSDYITTAVFEMVGLIWESVIRNLFMCCKTLVKHSNDEFDSIRDHESIWRVSTSK